MTIRAITAAALLTVAAGHASADITGSSTAHALSARVDLVGGVAGIDLQPVAAVAGAAPAPYNFTQTLLSASAGAPILGGLSTGLIETNAASDIGPGAANGFVSADATINDLELELVPSILLTPDLVMLSAQTVTSSASFSYAAGVLTPTADATIENAILAVGGVGFLAVPINPAPNTILLDAAGIRIVLNEQILSTAGPTTTLDVNAIHITVSGALNTIDADVVVAHSSAAMTVPTPGAVALLAGAGALALRRRRAV